jgi:predicted RNA-binding protein YlqC (UPF0109 family)
MHARADLAEDLRHLVLHIVEEIVDHDTDEYVRVDVAPGDVYLTVELHTHIDDIGQVVGSGGLVISSIRALIGAWGGKHRIQVNLVYVTERRKMARYGGR